MQRFSGFSESGEKGEDNEKKFYKWAYWSEANPHRTHDLNSSLYARARSLTGYLVSVPARSFVEPLLLLLRPQAQWSQTISIEAQGDSGLRPTQGCCCLCSPISTFSQQYIASWCPLHSIFASIHGQMSSAVVALSQLSCDNSVEDVSTSHHKPCTFTLSTCPRLCYLSRATSGLGPAGAVFPHISTYLSGQTLLNCHRLNCPVLILKTATPSCTFVT